jgi:hypothetical protein
MENGDLLRAAEAAGLDLLIICDKLCGTNRIPHAIVESAAGCRATGSQDGCRHVGGLDSI